MGEIFICLIILKSFFIIPNTQPPAVNTAVYSLTVNSNEVDLVCQTMDKCALVMRYSRRGDHQPSLPLRPAEKKIEKYFSLVCTCT